MASTSAEKKGHPFLARRNTFQRMLDLEKRNKLNRMEAPAKAAIVPQSRQSIPLDQDSNSRLEPQPQVIYSHNRAMTAPDLSLPIPKTELSRDVDGSTKKYVIKAGNVVPHQEPDSDAESGRSSICHSPGWDDYSGNKKKKEKKAAKEKLKTEKQKLETETKHVQRMKNRLSKPPPTSHTLKFAMATERTTSSPSVQQAPDTSSTKEDGKKSRSRRGSIDVGLKSLFNATQNIPTLWKHNSSTPPHATPSEGVSTPTAPNGFIGGLKLRLSEEAAAQNRNRRSAIFLKNNDHRGFMVNSNHTTTPNTPNQVRIVPDSTETLHTRVSVAGSLHGDSPFIQQRNDIYSQAGKLVIDEGTRNLAPNTPPAMERNVKDPGKIRATSSYFPSHEQATQNSQPGYDSRPRTGGDLGNYGKGSASPRAPKKQPIKNNVSEPRNDCDSSYVQNQRQDSRELRSFEDEMRIVNSPHPSTTRGRSPSFHSTKSRVSIETQTTPHDAPSTDYSSNTKPPLDSSSAFLFFSEYAPPKLDLNDFSSASSTLGEQPRNKGLKILKTAARSAFSRQSTTDSLVENNTTYNDTSRPTSDCGPTIQAVDGIIERPSKPERDLGEGVPHAFRLASSSKESQILPTWQHNNEAGSTNLGHKNVVNSSHARTATDSSEEYSLEEFSNVTTPMASRPQSRKEHFPAAEMSLKGSSRQNAAAGSSTSLPRIGQNSAIMPGAVLYNDSVNRSTESWSRSDDALFEMAGDDHHRRKPMGNASNSNSSASLSIPPALASREKISVQNVQGGSGLQRQLSISRSFSTPDTKDLSFLPTLKHQALSKPPNKKGKEKVALNSGKQPSPDRGRESKEIIRPRPVPLVATKSEGNSPESPTGGQYLRDARMNIPRPSGRSPNRNHFPGGTLASVQPAVAPIAKMFVVCCSCKYFHDMPSKIYECMAKPDNVVEDRDLGVSGVISTSVKCPWCGHGMSTTCCAGYAAVVYLQEKLH